MPTKTRKIGDHTWYDEVGELDEDLPEGPGYSNDNKGCRSKGTAAVLLTLVFVILLMAKGV
jgi:hypothetical protein